MSQTRTIQRAMSRRSMLKLVGGSGLALAATACAAVAPAAPTAAPATAAPVVPTAVPAKPITTVDWWTVTSADIGSQAQQEALIAEFNKLSAKTGAMVKPTFLPDDGFSEKMTTVLGTGTGVPDVSTIVVDSWFPAASDLRDLIARDTVDINQYAKTFFDTRCRFGEKIIGLPITVGATMYFYNKAMFDAKGLKYPEWGYTMQQWLADAVKMTDRSKKIFGAAMPTRLWRGEFFGAFPGADLALLGHGFHVVQLVDPNKFGAPSAMKHWEVFYDELTMKFGFSKKPALLGMSRGGLYCYAWAVLHPDKVACIYGDAPVCDIKSWPGGKGKGKGSPRDWAIAKEVFGLKDEAAALAWKGNPIDTLAPIAKAKIPIIHVYGDADEVVPSDENTLVLAERYRALGGEITLIGKPGVGHHPHGLDDPTPVVEFIRKACR